MIKGSLNSLHIQQERVKNTADQNEVKSYFDLLNCPQLLGVIEDHLPLYRQRTYPPTTTLALFISQLLNADSSCQGTVNRHALGRVFNQLPHCSTNTSGYCRARQRLPAELVSSLARQTGKMIIDAVPDAWHCNGRRVKLIDGTTVTMPDTPANQARYPQQRAQLPGLGFPIARLVAIMCLQTGAVIDAAMGPFKGKGAGELGLFMQLLDSFETGDIVIADRFYCNYAVIALLQARGVDVIMRQNAARHTDFRLGEKLGARDHVVNWKRSKKSTLTDVRQLPDYLSMRELKVGRQILVTTLRDPQQMPKKMLRQLYKQRWQVELNFRHIKTTLGMESLNCKTPQMNEKQMWVYLLGYNLIRLIMAQAAGHSSLLPCQLSFKHCLQIWVIWSQRYSITQVGELTLELLLMMAETRVGNRPGRVEPRALKKRAKPYPLLLIPRTQARAKIRQNGHPKKM